MLANYLMNLLFLNPAIDELYLTVNRIADIKPQNRREKLKDDLTIWCIVLFITFFLVLMYEIWKSKKAKGEVFKIDSVHHLAKN